MSLSAQQSARMKSDVWLTPPEILEPLGCFDLDPGSIANHPWQPGLTFFSEAQDGLNRRWFGRIWLNPPFGSEAAKWIEKLAKHGNGIALLAARTETARWFEHIWPKAAAICFLKGRPHFHYASGQRAPFNSGAPIVLIAYGKPNAECLRTCGLGKTVFL